MTLIQRLLTTLVPRRWADKIRAESQSWQLRCLTCGATRSVWDAGGIRYKAASAGKRTLVWCPSCRRLLWMAVERSTTGPQGA